MLKTLSFFLLLLMIFCNSCKRKIHHSITIDSEYFEMKAMDNDINGNKNAAIQDFDTAISLNHNNVNAYYGRARVKSHLKDYKGAIADINRGLGVLPKDNYMRNGDFKSFRADCEKIINKNSDAAKDYKAAIQDYNKTLQLYTCSGFALERRSYVEDRLKDYKAAITDMTTAIRCNPQEVFYYYNLADLKNKSGDYEGAILVSKSALKLKPNSDLAFFTLGYSYYQLKDYKSAIDDFNKCLFTEPTFYKALYYRGLAKFNLNEKNAACDDWHKATANGYKKADSLIKVNCE